MKFFNNFFYKKKILITGHTGFKGSWLALWLLNLGANVHCISSNTNSNSLHYKNLKLKLKEYFLDINDYKKLNNVIIKIKPEIVFHLAAQSLVKKSLISPINNFQTNIQGTVNLLVSLKNINAVKSIIVVTSDKCYENNEKNKPFLETDRIGGADPYSSSKAATEIAVYGLRSTFYNNKNSASIATVRAGNVIGGGDFAKDRIITDIVYSKFKNKKLSIRNINSVRPFQYVLDCLYGYLLTAKFIHNKNISHKNLSWNFGPNKNSGTTIKSLLDEVNLKWPTLTWNSKHLNNINESRFLRLNSSKSFRELKWLPVLSTKESINFTLDWYERYFQKEKNLSQTHLELYMKLLKKRLK